VAPASQHEREVAENEGIMRRLEEAGAQILPSACGLCAGYGDSVPENSTVIASVARNFKGRMGADSAQEFLASPYTVAASALRGRITDPREVLWDGESEGAR
jgi:3-isopropylmalate/(R)-2-methylmalate dehydratase large subunit